MTISQRIAKELIDSLYPTKCGSRYSLDIDPAADAGEGAYDYYDVSRQVGKRYH